MNTTESKSDSSASCVSDSSTNLTVLASFLAKLCQRDCSWYSTMSFAALHRRFVKYACTFKSIIGLNTDVTAKVGWCSHSGCGLCWSKIPGMNEYNSGLFEDMIN